ncbi:MAG: biotin--[acetyl-CoA-carboxylase] ligase [Candidatus Nanopelagicales bacterium]
MPEPARSKSPGAAGKPYPPAPAPGSYPAGSIPPDLAGKAIVRAIREAGGTWETISVVGEIGSTNAVMMGIVAASGRLPDGASYIADVQTAGRGRLDRSWVAPAGTAVLMSVAVWPDPERAEEFGMIPLLAGMAVADAIAALCTVPIGLKWPNDVMIPAAGPSTSARAGKVAGILVEREPRSGAVVVGCGINVTVEQFPTELGTSLALAGATPPARAALIGRVLASLQGWYERWAEGEPAAALLAAYRERCLTIGQEINVLRPDGSQLRGRGEAIGQAGELLLRTTEGELSAVVAGDVLHVLPS